MVKVSGCLGCLIAFLYVLFELFQSKQESNSASDFLQSYSSWMLVSFLVLPKTTFIVFVRTLWVLLCF